MYINSFLKLDSVWKKFRLEATIVRVSTSIAPIRPRQHAHTPYLVRNNTVHTPTKRYAVPSRCAQLAVRQHGKSDVPIVAVNGSK